MEYMNAAGPYWWCRQGLASLPPGTELPGMAWQQLASSCSQPSAKINTASRSKTQTCQVPGCRADLSQERLYAVKKRICSAHMQAPVIQCGDTLGRYCFQCAKVEPLSNFDGHKRSCRKTLNKRKQRPAHMTPAPSAAVPSSSHAAQLLALQQQQQQPWAAGLPMQQPQQMQHWVHNAAAAQMQQQQQQLDMQQSLDAAADMVRQVASMVAATRAGITAAPRAHAAAAAQAQQLQLMQQQQQQYECQQQALQQQQASMRGMVAGAAAEAAVDASHSPCVAESNTAAAAAGELNNQPVADPAAEAAEFDSFLAALLDADDAAAAPPSTNAERSGASGASKGSGSPTSSAPCSGTVNCYAPDTSCSSAAAAASSYYHLPTGLGSFPAVHDLMPAGWVDDTRSLSILREPSLPLPAAGTSSFMVSMPAAQSSLGSAAMAAAQSSAVMTQGTLPSFNMNRLGSLQESNAPCAAAMFPQSAAVAASLGMITGPTLAPAQYTSVTSSSCSTVTAGGMRQAQLGERIQHLNAVLMQVQSSVMALTQSLHNTQGPVM